MSRQYVSRLCKEGHLLRVRHGWYRAAPIAAEMRLHHHS
ncbi:type IV toxin-antitoxin system AbiEi family antitoxin domain-containing protein [Sphingobium scionense]